MEIDTSQLEVKDNPAEQRYEVHAGDEFAEIKYERSGDEIAFLHTEVPPALEGHGIAAKMAHTALDDARAQHLRVIPLCPYVASYMRRHREYLDLVPEPYRARAGLEG